MTIVCKTIVCRQLCVGQLWEQTSCVGQLWEEAIVTQISYTHLSVDTIALHIIVHTHNCLHTIVLHIIVLQTVVRLPKLERFSMKNLRLFDEKSISCMKFDAFNRYKWKRQIKGNFTSNARCKFFLTWFVFTERKTEKIVRER